MMHGIHSDAGAFARNLCRSSILAALALAGNAALARELTLEAVLGSPSISGPAPRSVALSPDGSLVTLLRNRAEDRDRYDLWAVDTRSGATRMLLDSVKVGSGAEVSEEEKMRRERLRLAGTKGIVDYQWSPDGKNILVPLDGDLFLADRMGEVQRLTDTKETELDAQVSETGRYVSFVRDHDFFILDSATGRTRQLTDDGSETLSWGVAEFVAQEEMARKTGHWWAPGDAHVAVARVDESGVQEVTRAAIGADGTRLFTQRYPAAGTPNARVDLYVMRPDGSRRVKVDLGDDPDCYLARVDWTKDGKAIIVQRQSRDQKRLDILKVDPDKGAAVLLFSELSDKWVPLTDDLVPLKDGALLWSSQRTGHRHLYRWKAGRWTQLTHGEWEVLGVQGVNEAKRRVYFTATKDDPDAAQTYWISLDAPGEPVRLTELGWANSTEMDEDATRMLVSRANPDQPPQTYLADEDGRRIAWIEENRIDAAHPYAPYRGSHVTARFGTLPAADGTALPYKLLVPPGPKGRRYPVFVEVYAGPSGGQVTRGWTNPRHQYLVDKGWAVFSVDGRGTPRRGRDWAQKLYHALGTVEVEDQLAGLKWLKQQAFVDPDRIALSGWSYGGFMVLKLLEAAPGAYAAGVAGAPVTRWELYDTHYTERYLGNPKADAGPYARADVLKEAGKINDPLLVVHGMADDNVVFENSSALIAKLQENRRPFEMMLYPGSTHAIAGEDRQIHLWRTIEAFLDRTVKEKK